MKKDHCLYYYKNEQVSTSKYYILVSGTFVDALQPMRPTPVSDRAHLIQISGLGYTFVLIAADLWSCGRVVKVLDS